MVPLSKKKDKDQVELKHIATPPTYCKRGFIKPASKKTPPSTHTYPAYLPQIHSLQGRKRRQYAAFIDLQKAYDTVYREKLWMILSRRCRTRNENNQTLEIFIIKMCQE